MYSPGVSQRELACRCELRATNASCRQRIESESLWMAAMKDHGLPVHVFRLAGARHTECSS